MRNRHLVLALVAAFVWGSFRAESADWIPAGGGSFHTPAHWDPSLPGTTDNAVFLLDATYTVTFTSNVQNANLYMRDGDVTFALGGRTYTLGTSAFVGNTAGEDAALTVDGGTLYSTNIVNIGTVGGTGHVTVQNGGTFNVFTVALTGASNLTGTGSGTNLISRRRATVYGPASLHIESGAIFTAQNPGGAAGNGYFIAGDANGTAQITVTGAGSLFDIENMPVNDGRQVTFGSTGRAVVTAEAGGRIAVDTDVTIGRNTAAVGTTSSVTVTGSNSRLDITAGTGTGFLRIGRGTNHAGALIVADRGVASTAGEVYLSGNSALSIGGGGVVQAGSLRMLSGSSTTLSLAAHDPGYVMMQIIGERYITGGNLAVEVDGSFTFSDGDAYRVMSFGSVNALDTGFAGLAEGDSIFSANGPVHEFRISYGVDDPGYLTLTAIPEPGTLLLLGGGVLALLAKRCVRFATRH